MSNGTRCFVLACSLLALVATSHAQQSALVFDGVDDLATTGDPITWPSGTSALTVEAWIYPSDISGWEFRGVVTNDLSMNMVLQYNDNSILAFSISNGPTDAVETPPGSVVVGRWDHFAGTYDGTTMRIYQNGELVGEKAHSGGGGGIGIGHPYFVGSWPAAGCFAGIIDEIRVWNVVRTEDEIATWMTRPLTGNEPGLLGYWRFNEGAGQVVADTTAYGAHGVLGSTAGIESGDPLWTSQVPPVAFFFDGFESANTDAWSSVTP
jgi:hypothetical protein